MGSLGAKLAIALAALCLARPGAAGTGLPQVNSTCPNSITLVGSRGSTPDAAGTFVVVVRDIVGNPLRGLAVVVDLSNCADLALCADQLDASALVNCAAKTVRKFTDASGSVSFTLLGRSNGSGNASTLLGGAEIYANGILIRRPTASCFDLDGVNGVGINDMSVWLSDFGAPGGPAFGRSDFDGDGRIDINDLSLWITAYGAGGSVQGCSTSCP